MVVELMKRQQELKNFCEERLSALVYENADGLNDLLFGKELAYKEVLYKIKELFED